MHVGDHPFKTSLYSKKKFKNCKWKNTRFFLLGSQSNGTFVEAMLGSFTICFSRAKWLRFNMLPHGYYAIKFMVCNQPFPALGVHNQDFKTNNIIVANKTSHDLIMF